MCITRLETPINTHPTRILEKPRGTDLLNISFELFPSAVSTRMFINKPATMRRHLPSFQ